jgi:hypothetical protein
MAVRRRGTVHSGYEAVPVTGGEAVTATVCTMRAAVTPEPTVSTAAKTWLDGIYDVLGGWLVDTPPRGAASMQREGSLTAVLEAVGGLALRAVMLDAGSCLPPSVWPTPAASRAASPSATTSAGGCQPLSPPADADVAAAAAGVGGLRGSSAGGGGRDAARAGDDRTTHTASKLAGSGKPAPSVPAGGGSPDMAERQRAAAAAAAAELEQLRREVSALRSSLGELHLTCGSLQEENRRLRSAEEGGEQLLSGALQQLMSDKSALQQQVARLTAANSSLQELLDFAVGDGVDGSCTGGATAMACRSPGCSPQQGSGCGSQSEVAAGMASPASSTECGAAANSDDVSVEAVDAKAA